MGTWRVQADYDLTPRALLYASASRGYKPGGVNGTYGQAVVPDTFTPETNTAFEIGSKTSLLDRRLQLNLASFYYLYRDMQYIEYDPVPFDSGISNIASVHEYGVEGEGRYVALQGRLHLDASLAIENSRCGRRLSHHRLDARQRHRKAGPRPTPAASAADTIPPARPKLSPPPATSAASRRPTCPRSPAR